MYKFWTQQEIKLLADLWSVSPKTKIVDTFSDRSWKSIKRKSEKLGLVRFRCGSPLTQWTDKLPSWLVGEMLSDGHIDPGGVYCHATKHVEYANFLSQKFCECGIRTKIFPDLERFDVRTGKKYSRWIVKTRRIFKQQRAEWYPRGRKIVPESIKLDDESIVHLFMGDGTASCGNISLSTMGFDSDSQDRLVKKLADCGLFATIKKDRNFYFPKMNLSNIKIVTRLVSSFKCPSCYQYKLNNMALWASTSKKILITK